MDEEALRLASGLEHIDRHGNLDAFSETQSGKLALMTTAQRRGLLQWNRDASRYELTSLGRQHLGGHRASAHPARPAARAARVPMRLGSPFSPGALIASAACVVLGVAVMAAALRSFDIELENPAAPPNKIASRQDSLPARSGAPARPDQVPAPVPPSSSTERPTAPPSTPHRAPAQVAPDSAAAESGSASSRSASANPQESNPQESSQTLPPEAPRGTNAPARTPSAVPDQVDETNAAADSGRPAVASQSMGATRHPPSDARNEPNTRRVGKSQSVVQTPSRAQARSHEKRNIDSGQARGWASGRTVNVTRRGPLLREERTLADGTVLVRYQYGNGPAHFEKRPKDGASRAPGYAYAPEHVTRPGRFDWLSR